jgi:NodT family efflux transporter outer membrane factor (OMF) lipoprotein
LLALGLIVAGCTLGPDFKPPDAPAATAYTAPDEAGRRDDRRPTIAAEAAPIAQWWTLFGSPQIDALVGQAVAGSPTLESAQARLEQSRDAIRAASSALFPQVTPNAAITREKVSATSFGLEPSAFPLPPNFNLYQVGPTVSYALDIFGGNRRRIEQQAALAEYQRHQLDAAYLTLTGNTVLQALDIAAARAQLRAVASILELDRQNLDLVQRALAAGSVPDSDVVLTQSQLATDETLRPGLDQQLSAARHALAVLLGHPPAEWTPPDLEQDRLTLVRPIPISLPSALVHNRPDILAAEAQLHAASAQIGVAIARLYPNITLSAGGSTAALDPGHLFNPASMVWSIAAGLSQPVFDGGLREAERQAALAAFKAAAADYRQTVLQAFRQVADLLQAVAHDADLVAAQKHALDTAGQAVSLQRYNYGRGGTGLLNLLDAQRQYQRALLGYQQAQAQRNQDTAQLLVAMGGHQPTATTTER